VHGEEVEIEYEDGPDRELYLCILSSDCLAWKRGEREHKRLMHEVLRKLPWREKLGGYIDDSRFMLAYSSNIEDRFEPYEVALRRLAECPIPEKPQRHRRRRLKLKPRTSYLGTRITVRKKRWDTKYNLC
jgi:hypothetical protein